MPRLSSFFQSVLSILTTQGDMLIRDSSGLARVPIGTAGQVWTVNAGATAGEWAAAAGGTEVLSVIETHEAAIAESTFTFSFSAINFDDDSELLLVIDASVTLLLELFLRINAVSTGYYSDGRRITGGTETLIDNNNTAGYQIASSTLFAAVNDTGHAEIRIGLTKGGTFDRVIFDGSIASGSLAMGEKKSGMVTGAISSLTDVVVLTTTSTWQVGTRMTLYRVRRAAV